MSKQALSSFFRRWVNRMNRRPAFAAPSPGGTKLRVEQFEDRLVPSTLPTPDVVNTVPLLGGFQPQAAIDPVDPTKIVVFSSTGTDVIGMYSADGGTTYLPLFGTDVGSGALIRVSRLIDPTIDPLGLSRQDRTFTNVTSPAVTFARDGTVYLTALEHNAAKTSGAVVVYAIDFSGGVPTLIDLDPNDDYDTGARSPFLNSIGFDNAANVLYRWAGQDPALNPTIAVDNNAPTFTDPEAGTTATDTMSNKAVYVAWNTDAATSQLPGAAATWNRNVILAAASGDKGMSFTTPVPVSDGSYFGGPNNSATAPQILFTPGVLNQNTGVVAPGQLTFGWSTINGKVKTDGSQPDNGNAADPAALSSGVVRGIFLQSNGTPVFGNGPVFITEAAQAVPNTNPRTDIPGRTDIPINVDLTTGGNLTAADLLTDLDVSVSLVHPHDNQVRIVLTAPNGDWVTLVNDRLDQFGNTPSTSVGLPDTTDLGATVFNRAIAGFRGSAIGTTFSDEAPRVDFDPANTASYNYALQPEGSFGFAPAGAPGAGPLPGTAPVPGSGTGHSTLAGLYSGLTAAQLSGTWVLTVFDVRDDDGDSNPATAVPVQFVQSVMFHASGAIDNSGMGTDNLAFDEVVPGAADQTYPTKTLASPTLGVGPGLSFAVDNTTGAFSPYSGRIYAAYTGGGGNNTDVFIRFSDDGGTTWSGAIQVNDDDIADNLTQGNRAQFMPSVAVDSATGTVVVTWYDARNDAANTRVATYIATSVDGGITWSTRFNNPETLYDTNAVSNQTWLNSTKQAIDSITGQSVDLEPIPSNIPASGSAFGFGARQSLIVHGGVVHPFWTGNTPTNDFDPFDLSGTPFFTNNNGAGTAVYTNTVQIAAGPRVQSSDMGPVDAPVTVDDNTQGSGTRTYNNTFAPDGTRQLDGFTVTFDRLIDVNSFTPASVKVFYRSPNTPLTMIQGTGTVPVDAVLLPVAAVIPLDENSTSSLPDGISFVGSARRFFVRFATPQSAVGTYSYEIGPGVQDRIRTDSVVSVPAPSGPATRFNSTDTPLTLADGTGFPDTDPSGFTNSVITVPAPAIPGDRVFNVRVFLRIDHTFDSDLRIFLISPDGTKVRLVNRAGGGGEDFGTGTGALTDFTLLDDAASPNIGLGTSPFADGLPQDAGDDWSPDQPLSRFRGRKIDGSWTLQIEDTFVGDVGTLQSWGLEITPGTPTTSQVGLGNPMDQDADGVAGEIDNDVYTAPRSLSGVPMTLKYDTNTLPLVVPGPHVVASAPAGYVSAAVDPANPQALRLTFDRAIPPANFTAADLLQVLQVSGGIGQQLAGPFTVTAIDGTGNPTTQSTPYYRLGTPANLSTAVGTTYQVVLTQRVLPDALVLNTAATGITVAFDRDIDPTTFTTADVLRIGGAGGATFDPATFVAATGTASVFGGTVTGVNVATGGAGYSGTPVVMFTGGGGTGATGRATVVNGVITGITVTNPGTGYTSAPTVTILHQLQPLSVTPGPVNGATGGVRTFTITFPAQSFSGGYSVDIGPDITSINVPRVTVTLAPTATGAQDVPITFASPTAAPVTSNLRVTGPNGVVAGATITKIGGVWHVQFTDAAAAGTAGIAPNLSYLIEFVDDTANPKPVPLQSLAVAGAGTGLNVVVGTGSKMDANENAGVSNLTGQTDPTTPLTTSQYTATPPVGGVIIPAADLSGFGRADLPVNVADAYLVAQDLAAGKLIEVQFDLSIPPPNISDLQADLVAPDGTRVRLFTHVGQPGQQNQFTFTNVRLNDTGSLPIQSATNQFNGAFTPQLPLSRLIGTNSKGQWHLEVLNRGSAFGTVNSFSLTLSHGLTGTGLGESAGDRTSVGFRVFIQDPSNPITQQVWTPVGPASQNSTQNAGRVTGLAADPSDPTGNTVYAGGASGGVWKTTDFLTTDPNGPHWLPLTDFGPTLGLNVGSIAVFGQNNDPRQSVVVVATGEGNIGGTVVQGGALQQSAGVGFLMSFDGGSTWRLYDSSTNVDSVTGAFLPINDSGRDHIFAGTTSFKVIIDPTPAPGPGPAADRLVIYAAVGGAASAQNGVWRSVDSGKHWTRIRAGNATDVVLGAGSAGTDGTLQYLYAGFSGEGVYFTPQATTATSMNLTGTNPGNTQFRDIIRSGSQVPIAASPLPTGAKGRISLAAPALTDDPLKNLAYKEWLYALVSTADGRLDGLYLTKDHGINWTKVRLPDYSPLPAGVPSGFATNDITASNQDHDPFGGGGYGTYANTLTIDPNNPNVVYLGGSNELTFGGFVRVDISRVEDAQFMDAYNNSLPDGGTVQYTRSTGGVLINDALPPVGAGTFGPGPGALYGLVPFNPVTGFRDDLRTVNTGFSNLSRNPNDPFNTNATLDMYNIESFQNRGIGARWQVFAAELGTDVHSVVTYRDPLTGKTRLIVGDDQGVSTILDNGDGTIGTGIGFAQLPNDGTALSPARASRNGDLQISQFLYGAVQPSQLAADVAGAMFYGMARNNGFPVSAGDILRTGNLIWVDRSGDLSATTTATGDGTGVAVDPTGSGAVYQYRWPKDSGDNFPPNAFFRYIPVGSAPNGFNRTGLGGELIENGDDPGAFLGQWPATGLPNTSFDAGSNFGINPINPNAVLMSSQLGRVFLTTNQGQNWNVVGVQPGGLPGGGGAVGANGTAGTSLDGTYAGAVAFGAPATVGADKNKFLLVGTNGGLLFATRTGIGPWFNASGPVGSAIGDANSLDGSAIQAIAADPHVGTTDVFVVTLRGVYFKHDVFDPNEPWTNVTGNLFQLEKQVFGQSPVASNPLTDPATSLKYLTSLAADWRYAIPIDPANPQSGTIPILYVGGEGGVFRSIDFGKTWTPFPDVATDGAPADGGYLPSAHVTDLNLSLGPIDTAPTLPNGQPNPTFGMPKQADGLNMLVATTYGRGTFAIRLGDAAPQYNTQFQSGPKVLQLVKPTQTIPGQVQLQLQFDSAVDPTTFQTSDIVLTDNTNAQIPITGLTRVSQTVVNGVPRDLWQFTFAQPSGPIANGLFHVIVGPTLANPGGQLMNQNGLAPNGESGPAPTGDAFARDILLNSNQTILTVSLPAQVTAGITSSFTVSATDSLGNQLGAFTGAITLSSSDTAALNAGDIPTAYTFTSADNGSHTFTGTFHTAGQQSIIVIPGPGQPTVSGSTGFTNVVAGASDHLTITGAPGAVSPGGVVTYTINAVDKFGNLNNTVSGDASVTDTDTAATLGGALQPWTVTLNGGTATFQLQLFTAGNQQVTATIAPLTGTGTTTVNPGVATHFVVTTSSTSGLIGTPLTVTVTALDQFNNPVTTFGGTVALSLTPGDPLADISPTSVTMAGGVGSATITFGSVGTYLVTATGGGFTGQTPNPIVVTAPPPPPSPTRTLTGTFGVGSGAGGSPLVQLLDSSGQPLFSLNPFPAGAYGEVDPFSEGFTGGNRTAVADFNGDGVADLAIGTGPTIPSHVLVIDGATHQTILDYRPFEASFTGGVYVAAGDINKDGLAELVITPDEAGGPRVIILKGGTFAGTGATVMANFFGINDPNFRGGARAAVGDVTGDGFADLVISAGFGGGPRISTYDGKLLATTGRPVHPFGDFFIFEQSLRNGAFVAVGDVNGDGYADIIGGGGPGGGPRVLAISGKDLLKMPPPQAGVLANFFAGNTDNRGGVHVAAKNLDGDDLADLVVGDGDGAGSRVTAYSGTQMLSNSTTNPYFTFDAFDNLAGVFVG